MSSDVRPQDLEANLVQAHLAVIQMAARIEQVIHRGKTALTEYARSSSTISDSAFPLAQAEACTPSMTANFELGTRN